MKPLHKQPLVKALLYVAGFWSLAFTLDACVSKADDLSETSASVKAEVVYTPVDGVVVKPSEIHEVLEITGSLVANQQVDIVSELTRRLVSVQVKEGSAVRKGDLLFKLDDADLQAQLERLRQQENLAKLNEERLRDLLSNEAISQQDYDQASTNLKVREAQIRELLVTSSKTNITAPFNGNIGIINVHPGSIVSVNTILTDIEDNSVIKVDFTVPEKYAQVITPGSVHAFTITSNDQEYKTKVIARAASVNENTRTLLVRGVTENSNGKLLPGQSVRLKLHLNTSSNALAVASNALI